jgi:hypothetical protein
MYSSPSVEGETRKEAWWYFSSDRQRYRNSRAVCVLSTFEGAAFDRNLSDRHSPSIAFPNLDAPLDRRGFDGVDLLVPLPESLRQLGDAFLQLPRPGFGSLGTLRKRIVFLC